MDYPKCIISYQKEESIGIQRVKFKILDNLNFHPCKIQAVVPFVPLQRMHCYINPLMPNGISHPNQLDEFILNLRVVR